MAKQFQADVTFCQDPDADRLAIIDEHGKYIGEELTLALCLLNVLPKNKGPVITNCATGGSLQTPGGAVRSHSSSIGRWRSECRR